MLLNHLTTAFRHFRRDKLGTFVRTAGLAVAMASVMVIAGYVWYEWGFDGQHPNAEKIYRVTYDETISRPDGRHLATVAPPLGAALAGQYPEVEQSVRVRYTDEVLMVRGDQRYFEKGLIYADSAFFDFFNFPFAEGDPQTALTQPNAVVITPEMAEKYFGTSGSYADILGESLLLDGDRALTITGVLAGPPRQSHLDFDLVASFSTFVVPQGYPVTLESWGWISFQTYVKVADGIAASTVEAKLPDFFAEKYGEERAGKVALRLQPLRDIYFHSGELMNTDQNRKGNRAYLSALVLIAFLLLAVSVFNGLNLSTTQSVGRSMEASVRKVLGASRGQLVRQFVTENILQCFVSVAIGLLLFELMKNGLADQIGWRFELGKWEYGGMAFGFVFLAFLIGALSGIYPAWLVSSFHPAKILKGNQPSSLTAGLGMRKALMVLQFAVTGGLVVCSLVVAQQMDYLRKKQPGYDREQVIALQVERDDFEQVLEKAKGIFGQNPNVTHLSAGDILDGDYGSIPMFLTETERDQAPTMNILGVGHGYFKTLGIEVVEGREFSEQFPTDRTAGIMLNETAVAAFGLEKPIGQHLRVGQLREGEIVGVVKDFHFHSLHDPVLPLVIFMPDTRMSHIMVRVRPGDLPATLASLEKDWKRIAPEEPFDYAFLDDAIQRLYENDHRFSSLIYFFTLLTLVIASLGLYGLMSVVVGTRVREIGIRKVLGASISGIVGLLTKDFLLLVLLGTLLAAPIAWWGMSGWLQNFSYRIEIGWWVFALAGLAAVGVAFLTISFQSIKAALANPVESLRNE